MYLAARAYFQARGESPEIAAMVGLAAGFVVAQFVQRRTRYIRASVRRKVIARDLKGEKFDGRKHAIDHRWPFARGGSNTADNLRVTSKLVNLKKGKKRPRAGEWLVERRWIGGSIPVRSTGTVPSEEQAYTGLHPGSTSLPEPVLQRRGARIRTRRKRESLLGSGLSGRECA